MMSDRHFQGNGIRLRAPEPEDLEVMFQVVTIMVYLLYLYWLSHCVHAPER